ncbi:MAG: DsbA family protein [Woeseiaceae bacterium]
MSRKTRSERAKADSRINQTTLIGVAVAVVVLGIVAAEFWYQSDKAEPVAAVSAERQAALASLHAPTLGDPGAKVHIVEFIDPACETCALFFPMVKKWMSEVPGDIRLSMRHAPFHDGSDYAVKILEASREQGKYWQTLEAMLASQRQWTQNHTVMPERIAPAIASVGLDMQQLLRDMNSVDILQRMEQDKKDAIVLKVTATPEYFVNGRPLPSFGQQQLADLVREELGK